MAGKDMKLMGRRLANAWLSSVISISLVLLLIGAASLLLVNARSISDHLRENMRMSVLMKQSVTDEEAADFCKGLALERYARSTELISKEQGIKEMSALLGDDFLDVFDSAPVPVSIDLALKSEYVVADSLDMVKAEIAGSPLVDEVNYQRSLVDALNSNLRKISIVVGVFVLLMLFISYVLINNTVRLNVYARRFTIHTMKMVGATKGFIRRPFLLQAMFQGLFSAMVAVLAMLGLLVFVKGEFPPFFEILSLGQLLLVLGIVIAAGLIICVSSTYFVVGKLVGLSKDDLYF